MLGSKLWDFSYLLTIAKEFTVDYLCMFDIWDWGQDGEFRNGIRGKLSHSSDVIYVFTYTQTSVTFHVNVVCGSAHCGGCVVSGNAAVATC